MQKNKNGITLIILILIIMLVLIIGFITITFVINKANSNNVSTPIIENNNCYTNIPVQKINRTVSNDFSYEHCSFWIDEEENDIFTFIGTDSVKFYSISNTGLYSTTGKTYLEHGYEENRGISVIVDNKYIVVISSENYRGPYWTTQKTFDPSIKFQLANTNSNELYALSNGTYQLIKEIDGKKIYFYTNLNKVANEISDLDEREEKICQILNQASDTIIKYDNSSLAINKVAQDEFTRFNLKVNSYKNIIYYCSDPNSFYNAKIQVDDYIFSVIFEEINKNQIFNYKMSDYTIGNNSIGYYESIGHTNLTIQNLKNNIYQNDYLIITDLSIPSSEENSILEYGPKLLNKVFSN